MIKESRAVQAKDGFNAMLSEIGVNVGDRGSLRSTEDETASSAIKKAPQITLHIVKKNGISVNIPWMSYRSAVLHGSSKTETFLELIFYGFNVVVFGRNLNEIMQFIKHEAVEDLAEATVPDSEVLPFYITEIIVIQDGAGESLFLDDREDRKRLTEFVRKSPHLKLRRADALEVTSSLVGLPMADEAQVRDP